MITMINATMWLLRLRSYSTIEVVDKGFLHLIGKERCDYLILVVPLTFFGVENFSSDDVD